MTDLEDIIVMPSVARGQGLFQLLIRQPRRSAFLVPVDRVVSASYERHNNPSKRLVTKQAKQQSLDVESAKLLLKKDRKGFYIFDQEIADCVVEKVCEKLPNNATLLECNPGLGALTRGFLKSKKVSKLIVAEPKEEFFFSLKNLETRSVKSKLLREKLNFFLPKSQQDDESFYRVMSTIKPQPWEADPPLSVLGVPAVSDNYFMSRLLHMLSSRDQIYMPGRTECFLFLSAQRFRNVQVAFPTQDSRIHHQSSVLYNLLFHSECLMQVDKKLFYPPIPSSRRRFVPHPLSTATESLDPDMMYLVHLRPKVNIPEEVMDWDELPKFVAFLKQITKVKQVRLIPRMESWVPGCGIYLILMDFSMMTFIHDLVPQQYVQIYKAMITWPEYQDSNLQLLLEREVSILNEDDTSEIAGSHIEPTVS